MPPPASQHERVAVGRHRSMSESSSGRRFDVDALVIQGPIEPRRPSLTESLGIDRDIQDGWMPVPGEADVCSAHHAPRVVADDPAVGRLLGDTRFTVAEFPQPRKHRAEVLVRDQPRRDGLRDLDLRRRQGLLPVPRPFPEPREPPRSQSHVSATVPLVDRRGRSQRQQGSHGSSLGRQRPAPVLTPRTLRLPGSMHKALRSHKRPCTPGRPARPGANEELYGGRPMILSGLETWLETGELLTTPLKRHEPQSGNQRPAPASCAFAWTRGATAMSPRASPRLTAIVRSSDDCRPGTRPATRSASSA